MSSATKNARHFFDPASVTEASVPQVDYHIHTDYTDGRNTVEEMHGAAIACGLEAILFSEHARKTSGDWFGAFSDRVRALPQDRCSVYIGTECKADGFDGEFGGAIRRGGRLIRGHPRSLRSGIRRRLIVRRHSVSSGARIGQRFW